MEISRFLQSELMEHLGKEEITLLIGPRQAGKTTLLRSIADQLIQHGATCLFFNLDIDTDAQHFSSQQRFVERVEALSAGIDISTLKNPLFQRNRSHSILAYPKSGGSRFCPTKRTGYSTHRGQS